MGGAAPEKTHGRKAKMSNKLELTWYGKEKPIKAEPRLLIERPELSNTALDPDTENMLIHGDNLLALKALEEKYTGQVKCIYIDPPFNTGAAFDHYDDALEHSIWLGLMAERFRIFKTLLHETGVLFVNLDDSEAAYAKVLLDEIFGRRNYMNEIIVATNKSFGFKSTSDSIFKQANHILFYARERSKFQIHMEKMFIERDYDPQYKWVFENTDKPESEWTWRSIKEVVAEQLGCPTARKAAAADKRALEEAVALYAIEHAQRVFRTASVTGGALLKRRETIQYSREHKNVIVRHPDDDMDYRFIGGERVISYLERLKELDGVLVPAETITDIWSDISVEGLAKEGGVDFPKGKKPEKLIQRCIELTTDPGDLVLDSFLGSGTTAAVAHKMGRRYIGIEMGEHAYTHCKVRLDKVIAGEDQSGVTKAQGWQGGGGYRFYELAPSLINEDDFGEAVINPDYDPDLLAAAVALHEGFTYQPDPKLFWKQAVGSGNSYLFTTARHLTAAYLDGIAGMMGEGEHLIIACRSFDTGLDKAYGNITVKKLPQMLLGRCEFGREDYRLNIVHPPVYEDEEECCDE